MANVTDGFVDATPFKIWERDVGRYRWLSPFVALALLIASVYVIQTELGGHGFQNILGALSALTAPSLFVAGAFAALSYLCLMVGEGVALTMIGRPLRLASFWQPSLTAYALGNALGFSFATAPAVRARLYKGLLEPSGVAAISAMTGLSVFAGAVMAAGLGLLLGATEIADQGFGAPFLWQGAGIVLAAPAAAWLAVSVLGRRTLTIAGVDIRTPPPVTALGQVVVASGDWIAAAAVLYVLLPDHGGWSFPAFVAVFVASGLLGALSGAPGGLGVFEASILALAPATQHQAGTAAALIAYRLIYTLAPLTLAGGLLGADIIRSSQSRAGRVAKWLGEAAVDLAPRLFATLTFASGIILLLSSATPEIAVRMRFVAKTLPLLVIELSHFLASICGLLLMAVAAGLWRRRAGAYVLSLALLAAGALFALFKGGDVEEALILATVAVTLYPCGPAFTRKSRLLSEPLSLGWLLAVIGVALGAAWLGFFCYKNVPYTNELWWTFLRKADASRFLRGAAAGALVIAGLSVWSLLAAPKLRWRGRPEAVDVDRANWVLQNAERPLADAHLALVGDKDLLFSELGSSFLMFRVRGPHWIAMSAPCGLAGERRELMWRFAELADEAGGSAAFYSIGRDYLADMAELGMVARKIGETAIVPISNFTLEGKARAGLCSARNRVEREGGTFEVLPAGSASVHEAELRAVSDAWLGTQAGAEKSFSLGRFDVAYLDRTLIAVVRKAGAIVAFANVWTTSDKRELTIDLMRHNAEAPKGVMDYLITHLIEWGRSEGFGEFDLGMAPLAGLDGHRLAPAFARIGAAVYQEAETLYGFRGLRAYKEKFDPEWRPVYLAARPGPMSAFALLDVALLTSGGWRGLLTKRTSLDHALPDELAKRGERDKN